MALIVALYGIALVGSIAFFVWSLGMYWVRRRRLNRALKMEVGPDSEPLVFALYCQYLLAPQIAVREAQQALAAHGRRGSNSSDFFVLLEHLQSGRLAAARRG